MSRKPASPVHGIERSEIIAPTHGLFAPAPAEPAPATERAAPAEPIAPAAPVEPLAAPARAAPVAPVRAVAPAEPVRPAPGSDRIAELAGRLRRGEIDALQAVDLLIDDAVHDNLAGLPGTEGLREELRAALQSYAQDNPFLVSRMRRLTTAR